MPMDLQLRGRTAALYGEFDCIGRDEAIRRLEALGVRVVDATAEQADFIFCAEGERGPVPVTDTMSAMPYLYEDALVDLVERAEGSGRGCGAASVVAEAPVFLAPGAYAAAGSDALRALLDGADWSAFTPDRDLPPLRARLTEVEREEGVTEAHRLATRRLRDTGQATLRHPYGHDVEIVGHALSPDGRWLATGSWVGDDYDAGGVLQIWEVATGRCVNTVTGINGGIGWPDYERTVQWSADATRIALLHNTNMVGAWDPTVEDDPDPLATIGVSDGNSRPSPYALAPDGRSVYYHSGTNGDGGLQGCLVPLGRGELYWDPNRLTGEHPFAMARQLPPAVRRAFDEDGTDDEGDEFRVGKWIEDPVFSPDGTRLYGSNGICVDAATRRVLWYAPARHARLSPDGRLVAHVTRRGLFFRDADDGRIRCGPYVLGCPSALRWAAGTNRLAALTPGSATAPPTAHIFDEDRYLGSVPIPHPEWEDGERWTGDRNAWAWAPDGQRAACMTSEEVVEVWDLSDPARPWRVRTMPIEDTYAVHWGADNTLVQIGATRVRFVRADTGEVVGDFTFLRVPEGPRPVEGDAACDLGEKIFTLDEHTWAMTLDPGAVIAPPGRADDLDAVLTWAVGRRHAWPVRWGDLTVLPDALSAADLPDSEDAELLQEYREELEELAGAGGLAGLAGPEEPVGPVGPDGTVGPAGSWQPTAWPPPNTATLDDLYEAARRALVGLDPIRWGFAMGPYLRAAARLRARQGAPDGAMALVEDIPDLPDRIAALSDVAVCLARAGLPAPARTAFDLAAALVIEADGKELGPDASAAFASACQLLGDVGSADGWFRHARSVITVEPNPWQDHIAVARAMLECGRVDLVRELLADRAGHPPEGYHAESEWLVHLARSGHLDLAAEFQGLPGWAVPYEVLEVFAEIGRADLVETWGGHDWYTDDLLAQAREAAAHGTPPVRPRTPSEEDIACLAQEYAELQRTPHAKRRMPTTQLIERAAECGHLSAVLDLLDLIPLGDDFNDRPSVAFSAIWLSVTGFNQPPM